MCSIGFQRVRANAFEIDALESTRPIEYPVHSPDDASGMFDALTYTKGGAVLRMLEQWLGRDRFRDGIRRYLRTHAYANTETHDLWDALGEETGEPVRRIMDAWIFQRGYPAITVRRDGARAPVHAGAVRAVAPRRPDDVARPADRPAGDARTASASTACWSRRTGATLPAGQRTTRSSSRTPAAPASCGSSTTTISGRARRREPRST